MDNLGCEARRFRQPMRGSRTVALGGVEVVRSSFLNVQSPALSSPYSHSTYDSQKKQLYSLNHYQAIIEVGLIESGSLTLRH